MARSTRRTPICGITTASSEKHEKVRAHRRERRLVSEVIAARPEAQLLPHTRELGDPWSMSKDGKKWFDASRHPRLLRK